MRDPAPAPPLATPLDDTTLPAAKATVVALICKLVTNREPLTVALSAGTIVDPTVRVDAEKEEDVSMKKSCRTVKVAAGSCN